jgi:hypothetical protein
VNLVEGLVDLGNRRYEIDWSALRASVLQRLQPTPLLPFDVLDLHEFPTYWCVPLLVGDYLGSTRKAVIADLEPFVSGCLVRHFMFDQPKLFDGARDDDIYQMAATAYDGCRLDAGDIALDARFAAKCRPWTVLLTLGTRSILRETRSRSDYDAALGAIVLVYSCLQIVDDWHDRSDDVARAHWNMWVDEPATRTLAIIEPLVAGAWRAVERLKPHLLRRALAAQFQDTVRELAEVVDLHRREQPRRAARSAGLPAFDSVVPKERLDSAVVAGVEFLQRRLDSAPVPLWRDFELARISGGSTECVSAFVADQLAAVPEGRWLARTVAARLLAQPREAGGWGYREDVPADCDSTAWVLLAAVATGAKVPRELLSSSQRFIIDHQWSSGGFATYQHEARTSLTRADQPGWFEPELSVTSSAVLALNASGFAQQLRLQKACRFIAACRDRGRWTSYWWQGFSYATFLATRALCSAGEGVYDDLLTSTQRTVLGQRRSDGGWTDGGDSSEGFATSLAVRTLMLGPRPASIDVVNSSITLLVDLQQASGAWPATAKMVAPGAAENGDLELRDNEVVTTACVVSALNAARNLFRGRPARV